MFLHILKDNKSKCIFNNQESMCKYIGKKPEKDRYGKTIKQNGKVIKSSAWDCKPVDWIKENSSKIARQFVMCYNRKEALPIYVSKNGSRDKTATHANMLLLNPFTMTAEHFEPHGEEYKGEYQQDKDKYFVPPQSNLKPAVSQLNKALKDIFSQDYFLRNSFNNKKQKEDLKAGIDKWKKDNTKKFPILKYETMKDVCPSPSTIASLKGFQEGDIHSDTSKLFDGILITEIQGYCAMWTMFHLDLRLKTLKRKSGDVFKEMIKSLTEEKMKTGRRYIELMRGMTKYAWEQLQEVLKNPNYNNNNFTKEDFIRYLNGDDNLSNNIESKVVEALKKLRLGLMEELKQD